MKKIKTYWLLIFVIFISNSCSYLYHNTNLINANKIYGKACGAFGKNPEFRNEIENFIKNKDLKSIDNWLSSLSKIKKTYAAEALIRLQNENDIKLSKSQVRKISRIKKSNWKINTCWGCVYSYDKIKDALSEYKLK